MLEDATTFGLMKYALFHFKPVRHRCQMQIIHQQKHRHCSGESYLACFCDTVQNHFIWIQWPIVLTVWSGILCVMVHTRCMFLSWRMCFCWMPGFRTSNLDIPLMRLLCSLQLRCTKQYVLQTTHSSSSARGRNQLLWVGTSLKTFPVFRRDQLWQHPSSFRDKVMAKVQWFAGSRDTLEMDGQKKIIHCEVNLQNSRDIYLTSFTVTITEWLRALEWISPQQN